MIFIAKGDQPITENQLQKRTQAYIDRDWTEWKRERALRTDPTELNAYMDQVAADTDTNRANNLFNQQLSDYTTAVARLAQYQVALGREEVTEMQDTTEQQVDDDGMPVWDDEGNPVYVQEEVITVTAIEPVEPTVERTVYNEDDPMAEPTVETIENPLITQDNAERAEAQAVVDATPEAVVAAYEAE